MVDPVDPRYDTVNRSLSKARNESILLNIIRSSHDWPMSFTTVPQVNPSMSNVTTVGLPSFLLGHNPKCLNMNAAGATIACLTPPTTPARDVIFGNQQNFNNATTVSSNFSVSSLETGTFYNGLLSPVSLHDLNYFIRQGYSRELLFWLFADTVEVTVGSKVIGFQYNPPDDYGCPELEPKHRCFREFVEIATITGLSVEAKTIKSGGSSSESGGKSEGAKSGEAAKSSGSSSGATKNTEYSRFCFDPVLAERGRKAMQPEHLRLLLAQYVDREFTPSPRCGSTWNPGKSEEEATDTLQFSVGPLKFKILTRSTNSIYQLLGKILKEERRAKLETADTVDTIRAYIPLGREDERLPILFTTRDDPQLLDIVPPNGQGCFVHTFFFDGDYCVPENGSSNTKHIFSLLAELTALKTQASELAITPAVRIVQ